MGWEEMTGWQPIETAPLDEDANILVWTGYSCDVVHYAGFEEEGRPLWFNEDIYRRDVTHWMPLPEAPK